MTTESRPENSVNETAIVSRLHTAAISELPYAVALGETSEAEGYNKTFTIAPEQCEWKPARPESLSESEGRITIRSMATGALKLTIGGFFFDSDEYQLEAAWFAANKTEVARAKPENPFVPTMSLTPQVSRSLEPGDELQVTTVFEPEEGRGWIAVVRIRLG